MDNSTPSSWTKEDCKRVLTKERLESKKTYDEFWKKLFAWHIRQYEKAGDPPELAWADNCLTAMGEMEQEMGLADKPFEFQAAKSIFRALKVIEPKKSIFGRFK